MVSLKKYFSKRELLELSMNKPTVAQLEITHNCNQKCTFCFRGCNQKKKFPGLQTEEWIKIFDKLWSIGIDTVNFSGGEVLFFKEIEVLIKEAKRRKFRVILNTNGTVDSIKKISGYVDEIVFSIHGIGELHDKLTGLPGAFKLAEKNLSEVVKEKKRGTVNISTVLVKSNFFKINEIYNYFFEKYGNAINSYAFNLSISCFYGYKFEKEKLILNQGTFRYYIDALQKIPSSKRKYKHGLSALIEKNNSYFFNSKSVITLPDCAGGKYKLVINYKGDVYPCRYFMSKKYFCGDVLNEDLLKIWQKGKGFLIFRNAFLKNILPRECTSCFKKERCFGGCKAFTKSYLNKGSFNGYEKDYRCNIGAIHS